MEESPPTSVRGELRALLVLTAPIALTNFGTMLLGLVDTAVVGRLGETALAAVGLGSAVFFTVCVAGLGWMLALDPLIAQAVGAREGGHAQHVLVQGLWVALFGALPVSLAIFGAGALLETAGIEAETAAQTRAYLHARLPAVLPWMMLAASRAFLQARTTTRPLVVGVGVANVINLPLTWLLVFGDRALIDLGLPALGVPRMGTAGAGLASAVATVAQLLIALFAVRALWQREGSRSHGSLRCATASRHLRTPFGPTTEQVSGYRRFASLRSYRPDGSIVWRVLRLGTPIGLSLLAEVMSFSIVAVLMGNLGKRSLASHNVAIALASATFQMALALGAAASVRVGHAIGSSDAEGTRRAGLVAIASGGSAMLLSAITFITIPRPLARILTDEVGVIEAAVPLLAVAAAFQLSDGVQAVAAGVLRGAGDTTVPLMANLAGHYAIGIPIGAALAFGAGWGAVGLWWGLSAGLTVVAILLTIRFWMLSRRAIQRA